MSKKVGATFGKSTPHDTQAVLLGNNISLFDFVKAAEVLCQVSDIHIQSDASIDDARAVARGKKKTALHDVIAKLDILVRRSQPIMPLSAVRPATADEILGFLLGKSDLSHKIHIGNLLRRGDVEFYLGGLFLNLHLAILGMIGTGKSNAAKIILSQVNWEGARAIVIDPHGEYLDGTIIDIESFNSSTWGSNLEAIIKRMRDTLSEKNLKIFDRVARVVRQTLSDDVDSFIQACDEQYVHGGSMLKPALMEAIWTEAIIEKISLDIEKHDYLTPLIINLKGVNKTTAQAMTKHISEFVLKRGKEGKGSYLFIDEAQNFVPQRETPECKTSIIDLVTEGRKFGCGVVLISQRPAEVDKRVLSQCNSKIILKLTNENDIKQVRASTEFSSKQMFDEVQRLKSGEGEALMVSSSMERPVFIKVDEYK